jgi:3-deoxy-D-manno-octulosonic acid kinase
MKLSRCIILNLATIVKPCQKKVYQQGNLYCVYDQTQIKDFNEEMLAPEYWQRNEAIIGTAQGRGTTYFVQHESEQWVLRHYYRGGLIGKLIKDSYLFISQQRTRAAQEFNLLLAMTELGLPVAKPIAYRVEKKGLFYHADLLTARISSAEDLVAVLTKKSLTTATWAAIGQTIQAFHQQGIYHHDLNAHNILIDQLGKIWLIDFDRGQQRKPQKPWQQSNINRLLRSFHKEKQKMPRLHWGVEDWQSFQQGYTAKVSSKTR